MLLLTQATQEKQGSREGRISGRHICEQAVYLQRRAARPQQRADAPRALSGPINRGEENKRESDTTAPSTRIIDCSVPSSHLQRL